MKRHVSYIECSYLDNLLPPVSHVYLEQPASFVLSLTSLAVIYKATIHLSGL